METRQSAGAGEGTSSPAGVLIVDDYEPFRRFVCGVLHKQQNLRIIGEARDGLEAIQQAEALQPDLIVLDIGLPNMNGIDAAPGDSQTGALRQNNFPDSRILH